VCPPHIFVTCRRPCVEVQNTPLEYNLAYAILCPG